MGTTSEHMRRRGRKAEVIGSCDEEAWLPLIDPERFLANADARRRNDMRSSKSPYVPLSCDKLPQIQHVFQARGSIKAKIKCAATYGCQSAPTAQAQILDDADHPLARIQVILHVIQPHRKFPFFTQEIVGRQLPLHDHTLHAGKARIEGARERHRLIRYFVIDIGPVGELLRAGRDPRVALAAVGRQAEVACRDRESKSVREAG